VPSPFDEVVEIGDAGGALGLGIGPGERLPRSKARSNVRCQPSAPLNTQKLSDQNGKASRVRFVVRLCLRLARRNAERVLFSQHHLAQLRECRGPFDWRQLQPSID
jgi:hypothetical protein